nr:RHS repeat domain-containing protein [Neisseria dumasiana]
MKRSYGYDKTGNLIHSTDQRSGTVHYEYDPLGQIKKAGSSLRPLQNPQKFFKFPLTSNSGNLEDFVHEQLFTHRRPPPHRKTSRPLPTHQTRPYS